LLLLGGRHAAGLAQRQLSLADRMLERLTEETDLAQAFINAR
jgi:hypothetical protein